MAKRAAIDTPEEGPIDEKPIEERVEEGMLEYGTLTLENRAIPNLHDGLKPVHRRLFWAAYMGGFMPDRGYRKAAKLVGDTMGSYHPHGDSSLYQALVGLVNLPSPLFDGQGNWGRMGQPAAAMRYTEVRMHRDAADMFFHPRYVPVIDKISNYDGTTMEPVVLPARYPAVLITGAYGIAMGATTHIPMFTLASVKELTRKLFARWAETGKNEVTVKDLMSTLKFASEGGSVISPADEIKALITNGEGRIVWQCDHEYDPAKQQLRITSVAPSWNIENRVAKLQTHDKVAAVRDLSAGGKINIAITFRSSLSKADCEKAAKDIINKVLTVNQTYRINVIERGTVEGADGLLDVESDFRSLSLPELVKEWMLWRIGLERKAAQHEETVLKQQLERDEAILAVIADLDALFAILKSKTIQDKPKAISQKFKISDEMGKWVWSLPISRFDRATEDDQITKITKLKKDLARAKQDQKVPLNAVLRDLGHGKAAKE